MLKIYGSSDDNVLANIELQHKCEACGCKVEKPSQAVVGDKEDEIGCYEQSVTFTIGEPDAGLIVEMIYEGVWAAKVRQLEEDVAFPWAIAIDAEGYTTKVQVSCPNGTPVKIMKRDA